ncbi:hypothetical protein Hanom_Chr13g01210901 [Helianthus anomalus]
MILLPFLHQFRCTVPFNIMRLNLLFLYELVIVKYVSSCLSRDTFHSQFLTVLCIVNIFNWIQSLSFLIIWVVLQPKDSSTKSPRSVLRAFVVSYLYHVKNGRQEMERVGCAFVIIWVVLSVHFRCVEEKKWSELVAQVRSVLKDYLKLRLSQGRKSKRLLEDREKELRAREAKNENEQRKLDYEKRMNETAIQEQIKADERMLKLVVDQKIKQMKGAIEVMKHMTEEDPEANNKMKSLQNDLKEKEEELEGLEELNQALVVKERKTKNELVA